jgi:hypothetical protein
LWSTTAFRAAAVRIANSPTPIAYAATTSEGAARALVQISLNHYFKEENLLIQLQRQWVPDDPAYIDPHSPSAGAICGVCSVPFEEPSVVAWAQTDGDTEMGLACMSCVEYLGKRNPRLFPTIEEYRELLERYPEPMYPSVQALEAAGQAAGYEDPSEIAYEPSWVWRRPREGASA